MSAPTGPNERKLQEVAEGDPATISAAAAEWAAMADGLDQVSQTLKNAQTRIAESWSGQASEAAHTSFGTMRTQVEAQAGDMRTVAASLNSSATLASQEHSQERRFAKAVACLA